VGYTTDADMNRSSLIAPSFGSYSYLLRLPFGISTMQVTR